MKKSALTCLFLSLLAALVFAGVMPGDKGDGAEADGCVTVSMRGGIMGDYQVSFTNENGKTSPETTGTPTIGGEPGETDECGWTTIPGGGTYRIHDGKLQKKNDKGEPVNMGRCKTTVTDAANVGGEGEGTLPIKQH